MRKNAQQLKSFNDAKFNPSGHSSSSFQASSYIDIPSIASHFFLTTHNGSQTPGQNSELRQKHRRLAIETCADILVCFPLNKRTTELYSPVPLFLLLMEGAPNKTPVPGYCRVSCFIFSTELSIFFKNQFCSSRSFAGYPARNCSGKTARSEHSI